MNPNDLLFLMITAALAAFNFGLIAFAVAMLARGIFQPQGKFLPRRIASLHASQGSRGVRA